MKSHPKLQFKLVLVVCLGLVSVGFAQSSFKNLGFELAAYHIPSTPPGSYDGYVAVSNGLRFWSASVGANQVDQVLHNNLTLGTPAIAILGPYFNDIIIAGDYTVHFMPFFADASLAQSGTVPNDAKSLRFSAVTSTGPLAVSFSGQSLPVVLLLSYPLLSVSSVTCSDYGVDVSAFSGQTGELRFTAQSGGYIGNNSYLDSIQFSSVPIPEPSGRHMMGLGAVLYLLSVGRRFARSNKTKS